MSRLEQQVCGAVDNTSALPTAPQTQQQQQKRRTYDSLLKADICTRYRHPGGQGGARCGSGEPMPRFIQEPTRIGQIGPRDLQVEYVFVHPPQHDLRLAQQGAGAGIHGERRRIEIERAAGVEKGGGILPHHPQRLLAMADIHQRMGMGGECGHECRPRDGKISARQQ